MNIYRTFIIMQNPIRSHSDLWSDYDEAYSYYNGVKDNPDCIEAEIAKLSNTADFSMFNEVEIIASYS